MVLVRLYYNLYILSLLTVYTDESVHLTALLSVVHFCMVLLTNDYINADVY